MIQKIWMEQRIDYISESILATWLKGPKKNSLDIGVDPDNRART